MEEKLRTFKTIAWLIAGLLALELVMLGIMLRPVGSFYIWSALGIIALLCIYLVRLVFVLFAELKKKNSEK